MARITKYTATKLSAIIASVSVMSFALPIAPSIAQQHGIASVYTTKHGLRTASGRRLSNGELTAAHRTFPFGSKVKVTNKRNGKSVVVTITDRGPFIRGRVIDLTMAGARSIGMGFGLAPVSVSRL